MVPHSGAALRCDFLTDDVALFDLLSEKIGSGASYQESFILADVDMDWQLPGNEVFLFLSPDGLVVVAQLPGGSFRIVATQADAAERPTVADIQRLMDARGPKKSPAQVRDVRWSSRFHVHHRLADRYRDGRILLAGDAAHVHSPAGGQGMNTGIQDAAFLGRVLAEVVAGKAPDCHLNKYEQRRRPIAQRVVAFTDRLTRMATLNSAIGRTLRNTMLTIISRIPALPLRLATELSGLRYR